MRNWSNACAKKLQNAQRPAIPGMPSPALMKNYSRTSRFPVKLVFQGQELRGQVLLIPARVIRCQNITVRGVIYYEGDCSRGRPWDAAFPADEGHEQTSAAGIQSPDDLLPDPDARGRRHLGDPRRHRWQQCRGFSKASWHRKTVRVEAPRLYVPGG